MMNMMTLSGRIAEYPCAMPEVAMHPSAMHSFLEKLPSKLWSTFGRPLAAGGICTARNGNALVRNAFVPYKTT